MKIAKVKMSLGKVLVNMIIAVMGIYCAAFFLCKHFQWMAYRMALFYGMISFAVCFFPSRCVRRILFCIHGVGVMVALAIFGIITIFGNRYGVSEGSYAESVYGAPNKVMIIATHPDDEWNLAAGVMESYKAQNKVVQVVVASNGDPESRSAFRLQETLRAVETIGIAAEDVFFLGYGDYSDGIFFVDDKIYSNNVYTSLGEVPRTHGIPFHPDYRTKKTGAGADYTRENMMQDMRDIIVKQKPDVIFCVDQDAHAYHKLTSMVFEEAMGSILKSEVGYKPTVYKGFAYSTAWTARGDFYSLNNPSTSLPYEGGRMEEVNYYLWEDRIRLPIFSQSLTYTLRSSKSYGGFVNHATQSALKQMPNVINGDKVYWQRRTDSVLYSALFTASNTNAVSALNDFELFQSESAVWRGRAGDYLNIKLTEDTHLEEIVLYDNPSMAHNILRSRLTLSTGESIDVGPLDKGGAETVVRLENPHTVTGFTFEILETEGEQAGLSEVEAYEKSAIMPEYIKIVDMDDNFVYTYIPETDDRLFFGVYGSTPELRILAENLEKNFVATVNNKEVCVEDNFFVLQPLKEDAILRIMLKEDASIFDEVTLRPYSEIRNQWIQVLQKLDEIYCSFSMWTHYYAVQLEKLCTGSIYDLK